MTLSNLITDDSPPERQEKTTRRGLTASARPPSVLDEANPATGSAEESGQLISEVFKYLRIISKHRWLIASITLLSFMITAIVTLMMTPLYTATASIQIEREVAKVFQQGELEVQDSAGLDFYNTQEQLLGSRSLAERAVDAMDLTKDSAFNADQQPPLFEMVLWQINYLLWGNTDSAASDKKEEKASAENTVEMLRNGLSIEIVRGSRIAAIRFTHPNPSVAMRVANGFAETFIKNNLDRRFEATAYARAFLEERLAQLKIKLQDSEKQLVAYADNKGIMSLSGGKTVVDSDVEAVAQKLTEARYEKIRTELMWKRVENAGGMEISEIRNNETVQENRKLRSELAAEYQEKLNVFKNSYTNMVKQQRKITELDKQLDQAVKAVKSDIKSAYEAAKISVAMLEDTLAKGKDTLMQQRNLSIQLNILQREGDTNRQLYDGLLQRYKEIGVAGGIGTNNISFVDRAQEPLIPSSPKLLRNLVAGLLAGLLLGCGAAVGLSFLDETFKTPEDVQQEVGVPVMGIIPVTHTQEDFRTTLSDQRSTISEAYRSLSANLQFSTPDGLPSSLLITSTMPGEGKTSTTIGVSSTLGRMGLTVLIIDADMRKPSIHKQLDLSNDQGLSNYLTGHMKAEDMLQMTSIQNVYAITSGPLPPSAPELLSGTRMADLVEAARDAYDIVIVDAPPVIGLADAPLLSTATEATLIVVAANSTKRSAARFAVKRIQAVRSHIIGSVLNKFDKREAGYGYGYGYGNYYYYGHGEKRLPSPRES